jgi:hypothetical protein
MKYVWLFFVAVLFRFLYLGVIPVSLAHDETDNVIQAHSVIQTGRDIVGTWSPLDFLPNSGVMAELGPVINAPALAILPNNLFAARFTTALLSSIFPLLVLYWLTLVGVGSSVATVTAWLLVISPWHILFSRTVLEQPTSLFFYLLSWIFLSRLVLSYKYKQSNFVNFINLLFFTLTYGIGFYTYHGYKFSLPILTSILLFWHFWINSKKKIRILLIIPALFVVGLVLRTALNSTHYASRGGELLFGHTAQYNKSINDDRRQSLAPEILKRTYSNKPLKLIQSVRDKYVGALNPDLLFLHGESNGVFSTWQTGYLYLITLPFLLLGIGYLLLTHKREQILILCLLVVSPIASIIHVNNTVAFRSGIYFVFLNIVTAYGLIQATKLMKPLSQYLQYVVYVIFATILISSLSYFYYIYFYVFPVTNAGAYFYNDRVVANYVRLTPSNKTLLIVNQPRYLYSAITLTSNNITKEDIDSFNHRYSPSDLDEYHRGNLTVVKNCKGIKDADYETVIISKNILGDQNDCEPLIKLKQKVPGVSSSSLVSPLDSGEEYRIVGDKLCENNELSSYVHPTTLTDFRLEQMKQSDFCVKWVVRQ